MCSDAAPQFMVRVGGTRCILSAATLAVSWTYSFLSCLASRSSQSMMNRCNSPIDFALDSALMQSMEAAPSAADFGRYHLFSSCHARSHLQGVAAALDEQARQPRLGVVVIKHDASALLSAGTLQYRVFLWNRSVGFSKRSYLVKHEVLSCDTLFHQIGPLMNKRSYPVKRCFRWIGPLRFHRKNEQKWTSLEHLNRMLGSSLSAILPLTTNGPRGGITCARS